MNKPRVPTSPEAVVSPVDCRFLSSGRLYCAIFPRVRLPQIKMLARAEHINTCAPSRQLKIDGGESNVAESMLEWVLQQLVSAGVGVVAGILIERWRRKWELEKEAMREHFTEIKKCLSSLSVRVSSLRHSFILNENSHIPSVFSLKRMLVEDEEHWWENFSLKDECGVLLFEDLKNHYPSLYFKLLSLEKFVRERYPEFLHALILLLRRVEEDQEFKCLREKIEKHVIVSPERAKMVENYRDAVIFISLGIDRRYWPNLYSLIKAELSAIEGAGKRLYATEEARKLRSIREETLKIIRSLLHRDSRDLAFKELEGEVQIHQN
jgi:hypothetical protein